MRILPATLAIALGLTAPCPAPAQVMYSVHDLGAENYGSGPAYFGSINASGQTTGAVDIAGGPTLITLTFRVNAGGQVTDPGAILGTLGSTYVEGRGINDSGQVTGGVLVGATGHPFRSDPNGSGAITDLGTLGMGGYGFGINNLGQVVGEYQPTNGNGNGVNYRAFRTAPNGLVDASSDLGTFNGSGNSEAYAINNSGQVTGYSYGSSFSNHAFRTSATGTIATADDLGTLGGPQGSQGLAINASGQVAGESSVAGSTEHNHAFRSTPNGQPVALQDLGVLPGFTDSTARGINSLGVVVGDCGNSVDGSRNAFIYDTQMRNLNDLVPAGWIIDIAYGINDSGQIAATGSYQGFGDVPVVLMPIPVPEPGSLALLGVAAGGWALWRRRGARRLKNRQGSHATRLREE